MKPSLKAFEKSRLGYWKIHNNRRSENERDLISLHIQSLLSEKDMNNYPFFFKTFF